MPSHNRSGLFLSHIDSLNSDSRVNILIRTQGTGALSEIFEQPKFIYLCGMGNLKMMGHFY